MDLTLRLIHAKAALVSELNTPLAEFDLTVRAYWVISKAEPAVYTQRQLAESCEIDKTSMVALIDDLEERGILERNRSATDRRAWIISVTDEGRALLEKVRPIVERVETKATESIDDDELNGFLSALTHLADRRRTQLQKSSGN